MTLHSPAITLARTPHRPVQSLDGLWEFHHEEQDGWHEVRVPGPWQAGFPDLAWSFGRATYRRRFTLPPAWEGCDVALCFGAVSEFATVRLNGAEIARHEGGWLPFEVILPPHLLQAENVLEVDAALPDGRRSDLPDFAEYPHGKQSWYGPQGGIWQSVYLEARQQVHIRTLRLDPSWPDGRLTIAAQLSAEFRGSLRLEITGPDGGRVHSATISLENDRFHHTILLRDIAAWSPDTPALYSVRLILSLAGGDIDAVTETFGFRKIETRDGALWLNGQPLYLRGALDQDYYPDGFYTVPSVELLEDQLHKAKAMGLNCLRCHIKVPDPRYYEVADRLGMLIWTEIPNVETFSEASSARLRQTMEGILARDRNHPSIIVWTLVNEDWGTRLREVADQRAWLSDMVDWLRAEDPLRLVVDNSACFPNHHVKTDINDYHFYRTAIDRRQEWDALCAEFAAAADWTWGNVSGTTRTGKEPLILSEFGVWGLPDPKLLRGEDGKDPWWMPYGSTWADETALPIGVEGRFAELGLKQVFGSFDAFIEGVQWYQWMNLKYEIEVLRSHPTIAGYVITEFTDVHWEGNGLLDMARNPRVFAKAMPSVNADIVIAPGLVHHAVRAGQTAILDLKVATGGASLPEGCTLEWSLAGQAGQDILPGAGPMTAVEAPLSIPIPAGRSTGIELATLRLLAPDGSELARNEQAVSVHGERGAPRQTFSSDDEALADRLSLLGFERGDIGSADVFVTHDLHAQRVEDIHAGARVLQIVARAPDWLRSDPPPREGPMTLQIDNGLPGMQSGHYFAFPGYKLVNRHRSIWRGDWVGNFSWLRRDGVFSHVPGGPLFDLGFSRVVPDQVMVGFRPWEFRGRVHAGVVVGWVHRPGCFLLEKRLGKGKLVATTFRLNQEGPDVDPLATALYDGMMELAVRP